MEFRWVVCSIRLSRLFPARPHQVWAAFHFQGIKPSTLFFKKQPLLRTGEAVDNHTLAQPHSSCPKAWPSAAH